MATVLMEQEAIFASHFSPLFAAWRKQVKFATASMARTGAKATSAVGSSSNECLNSKTIPTWAELIGALPWCCCSAANEASQGCSLHIGATLRQALCLSGFQCCPVIA